MSVVLVAIIFSHSEDCLFTLLIVSFAVQKLLSLIRSQLFIFLILSSMSSLYILETNPLPAPLFANIFSHSMDCLFFFFTVSFAVQKLKAFFLYCRIKLSCLSNLEHFHSISLSCMT